MITNYHLHVNFHIVRWYDLYLIAVLKLLNSLPNNNNLDWTKLKAPRPDSLVVSMSDSLPGGCEFDPRLRRTFFPAYFHLSPLQKHVRKVVCGFGKKSCVSTGVRKPGNTCASPTAKM